MPMQSTAHLQSHGPASTRPSQNRGSAITEQTGTQKWQSRTSCTPTLRTLSLAAAAAALLTATGAPCQHWPAGCQQQSTPPNSPHKEHKEGKPCSLTKQDFPRVRYVVRFYRQKQAFALLGHRSLVQMLPSCEMCTGYTLRSTGSSFDFRVPSSPRTGLSLGHHLSTAPVLQHMTTAAVCCGWLRHLPMCVFAQQALLAVDGCASAAEASHCSRGPESAMNMNSCCQLAKALPPAKLPAPTLSGQLTSSHRWCRPVMWHTTQKTSRRGRKEGSAAAQL